MSENTDYMDCFLYDKDVCGIWSKNRKAGLFEVSALTDSVNKYLGNCLFNYLQLFRVYYMNFILKLILLKVIVELKPNFLS